MPPSIDHDEVENILRQVAADKIIPRFQQLLKHEIRSKSSPGDLVTIADEEAEIELKHLLEKLMPGSEVIGEEAVSGGRAVRELLSTADHPVWVVDPVDGTSNFAGGIATYGTMVALIHRGERIASWIYQIPRGRIIAAEKGAGITIDRMPFQTLPKIEDDLPFGDMDAFVSRKFMPPPMRPAMEEKFKQLRSAATCMCCAWEYIDVLEGKAAFSVYSRIEPWDHMAGALILEEAGFYTRKWDGSPYLGTDLKGGLINAPSEAVWKRIYEEFLAEALRSLPRG